ncbi:MAG: hypothetical protein RLZZ519_1716 [Bacteroidota bacterium]|jgi:hypothetical protein
MSQNKTVDSIKVRMYRHGFGDCFLVSFMAEGSRCFSMLIDCGLKKNAANGNSLINEVVTDLKRELVHEGSLEPRLDVLVITHEHWDHLSAFLPTEDINHFKDFKIGQVWLPWTENPEDEEAVQINSRLRKGAVALGLGAAKLAKVEEEESELMARFGGGAAIAKGRSDFHQQLNEVLGFYGFSVKEVSENEIRFDPDGKVSIESQRAMENVIELGKSSNGILYLAPGSEVNGAGLPSGIKVHVLGPPRNSLIHKSNPSAGQNKETYFGFENGGLTGMVDGLLSMGLDNPNPTAPDPSRPFKQGRGMTVNEASQDSFFQQHYFNPEEKHRRIENSWLNVVGQFALQLDSATNNTSLVLAIELEKSGKILLFPGDAQVGSWLSWHAYEWNSQGSQKRTTQELLERTVLYKVSHHGSHNATVKEKGLEMMTHPDLVAMIPEKEKSYNGILHQPLMEELDRRCKGRVIVSADIQYPPEDLLTRKPNGLSEEDWENWKRDLHVQGNYVEYTVWG